jgi:hypothetical protein
MKITGEALYLLAARTPGMLDFTSFASYHHRTINQFIGSEVSITEIKLDECLDGGVYVDCERIDT